MATEVHNRMLGSLDEFGLRGGKEDNMEWDSSLIDELSSILDVNADWFQDVDCSIFEEMGISTNVEMFTKSHSDDSRTLISTDQPIEKRITPLPTTSGAPVKRKTPLPVIPKLPIQPKTVMFPTATDIHTITATPSKTVLFQPLTTLLPKQPVITIQPAPPTGQQVLLTANATIHLPAPGIVPGPSVISLHRGTTPLTTPSINILPHTGLHKTLPMKSAIPTSVHNDCGADASLVRRQQRMIKNRVSAFQSRQKKKEYMQGLEFRLRAALSENERLKKENGSLQKLLEEVVSENQELKVSVPKRRVVCLMVMGLFLMMNFNLFSILEYSSGNFDMEVSAIGRNRRLLEFSPQKENEKNKDVLQQNIGHQHFTSTEKALMVVKEDPVLYVGPPCQSHINQTESIRINQELRGWVHRHEVERTKSRRMASAHKVQAMQPSRRKGDASQLVTVQYTDVSLRNSNELQIYYSSPRSYQNFFEAIHRRGDTFYVVSFRRDHLLLPATNRNKTNRPKMSIILPSTNVNENVINGQEYEVMMQIDCEVMDTRILHVKSASIPQFLREQKQNKTNSFYNSASSSSEQAHVLSAVSESPL